MGGVIWKVVGNQQEIINYVKEKFMDMKFFFLKINGCIDEWFINCKEVLFFNVEYVND